MFEEFITKNNLPKFRLTQLNKHFYKDLVKSFDEFTTLSKDIRDQLKQNLVFSSIELIKKLVSSKGDTVKYLFRRKDDKIGFETVLMKHKDGRNTICVSSMIGCPVGCKFCATGKMGFLANLNSHEIVDQVLFIARELRDNNESVTKIVFMGMGEPLLNTINVIDAINTLTSPEKFALGARHITISTSGYITGIKKLIESNYKGKLAISLHGPTQELREIIMPTVAKSNPLSGLFETLEDFQIKNSNRISFEYILIKDLTDTEINANLLIQLLRKYKLVSHVNLIPFNEIPGTDFEKPDKNAVVEFSEQLTSDGISNTIRVTMGADVNAACGQLATNATQPPQQ